MADSAPVLIWIAGTDQGCTYVNRYWLEFTGRTMESELGFGWAEGIHADDRHRALDTYRQAFDQRRPFRMDYRHRNRDGHYRWLFDIGVPRYEAGEVVGDIGSCVDITDRVEAEERVREHQEWLQVTLASIGDAVIATDTESRVSLLNPVAQRLT